MAGSRFIRRAITWALLGLYCLVASGLPLPMGTRPLGTLPTALGTAKPGGDRVATSRLAAKDRSRPFPCMDKACGCATAEQCFANCCCHTPAERLAWARVHKVEPAVLAMLEARIARQSMKPVVAVQTPAAAQGSSLGSCCATAAAAPRPSCCASAATAALDAEHENEPTPRRQVIVLRALLACGGLAAEWFALGGGGLPPPRVEFVLCAGREEPLVAADETPFRLAAPPAAPPPRAA